LGHVKHSYHASFDAFLGVAGRKRRLMHVTS
jgi:hypothetical protein